MGKIRWAMVPWIIPKARIFPVTLRPQMPQGVLGCPGVSWVPECPGCLVRQEDARVSGRPRAWMRAGREQCGVKECGVLPALTGSTAHRPGRYHISAPEIMNYGLFRTRTKGRLGSTRAVPARVPHQVPQPFTAPMIVDRWNTDGDAAIHHNAILGTDLSPSGGSIFDISCKFGVLAPTRSKDFSGLRMRSCAAAATAYAAVTGRRIGQLS